MPGIVYTDRGVRLVPVGLDCGAINTIVYISISLQHCRHKASRDFLEQVEKNSLARIEEWKRRHPEAFEREYYVRDFVSKKIDEDT